jgi:hypothetical protein
MSSFLQDSLLELVLKYGILSVRSQLESICKNLYEDLSSLYGEEEKKEKEKKVETRGRKKKTEISEKLQEQEPPPQQEQEQTLPQELPPQQEQEPPLKRRIVKKGEKVNILVQKLEEHGGIDEEDKLLLTVEEEPVVLDPKEQQRLAVEAKHNELLANGVDPESLLTRENLEQWLKSGKSYQRIARDYVGLHESIVSAKAREFGFQSLASKYKFIRKK